MRHRRPFPGHSRVWCGGSREVLEGLDASCAALMAREGIDMALNPAVRYFADVCYMGQSYHLEIPLEMDAPDPIARLFEVSWQLTTGSTGTRGGPAWMVNLRAAHRLPPPDDAPAAYRPAGGPARDATSAFCTAP